MKYTLDSFKKNQLWHAVCVGSLTSTWLIVSSVVQASDLQIYAVPEAGKKTLVMMLDTSGSMNSYDRSNCNTDSSSSQLSYSETVTLNGQTETISYKRRSCGNKTAFDRLTRVKDGMMALLNSNNSDLTRTSVGLGNFSTGGDGKTGQILVAAKPLGVLNSPQRVALKKAIANLSYSGNTPTAHAYAEAASYLMGTSTYASDSLNVTAYKVAFKVVQATGRWGSTTYSVYTCQDWNDVTLNSGDYYITCKAWNSTPYKSNLTSPPANSDLPSYDASDRNYSGSERKFYTNQGNVTYSWANNTGIANSKSNDTVNNPDIVLDRTATDATAQYSSPLPAINNRQSCDGQGVYILSDGEANGSSDDEALSVMKASLTPTYASSLNCTNSLVGANGNGSNSAMECIANYSKKLFNPTTNPTGVSIKTAFVGFGSDMNNLTTWPVKSSCQWSSRSYNDPITKSAPNDRCSPGTGTLAVPAPTSQTAFDGGLGNGGFFIASTDNEVTQSVLEFIRNLGGAPLAPLTTGAIAVPYDSLNPKTLDTAGYLRALEPNPASTSLTWRGNLKKYDTILTGTNAGAFEDKSGNLVFNSTGDFAASTKDYWNTATTIGATKYTYNDGGNIEIGGVRWHMPVPTDGQTESRDAAGNIVNYAYASSGSVRNFYTDAGAYDSTTSSLATVSGSSSGTALLQLPTAPTSGYTTVPATSASYILDQFATATTIKDYPALLKRKLLNYLGFNLELSTDALPSTLPISKAPYFSMGGIIHSYPVQLTYSGTLDANGDLTTTRDRSILFGTMEGGLHIVDASSGDEQSVFVPVEILNDVVKSKALSPTATDPTAPSHGVDGAWVADSSYQMSSSTSGTTTTTKVQATKMNVYGGLRMGGGSYYGLDVLDPKKPKLLFRINSSNSNYADMGQSWSKPVLASVRYGGEIKRVMIIGGGYDQCYENPNFKLGATGLTYPDSSCNGKITAKGNAVYIVDAKSGDLIWSATYDSTAGDTDGKKYLKHSIVSRISTLDRDADGLVDHLYFGDLGGQVFRIDLDNNATSGSGLGKRVTRLANLASAITDTGYTSSNTYLDQNAPRFYEPVTVTIHDAGGKTFILVGAASGDRSTPLDVAPVIGREGMQPATALSTKPVNNVYGIIDADFSLKELITGTPTLTTVNKTMADLIRNPQLLPTGTTNVISRFISSNTIQKFGWYRSLSSLADGTEKSGGAFRREGGMKAFEEPVAITNNLLVSVYDPEGDGVSPNDPCNPRIVGETDWQKFCLPFGACLKADGTIDSDKESKSGFQLTTGNKNSNVLGAGIRGISFVAKSDPSTATGSCGRLTMSGNTSGTGEWQCSSKFIPTRWYERYR